MIKEKESLMIEKDWNKGSWGKVAVPVILHTGPQLGERQEGHQTFYQPFLYVRVISVVATVIKGQYDEKFWFLIPQS